MTCKITFRSKVFKGVIKDNKSKFIKKEVTTKSLTSSFILKIFLTRIFISNGDPKGNLYIITSRSKTFHQGKEKEINRDSESNGE